MNESSSGSPLISIITPSFNQGRFLADAIESVLNQDFDNFEYIIIDGGSSDNSPEIIRSYEAELQYWVSEPDSGQSDGINKGFRLARGKIVAWLNADDLYLPGCLSKIAECALESPGSSFYYGNGYRGDEHGKPKELFFKKGTAQFHYAGLAFGLNYILQPSAFINRRILQEIDYIREDLEYGMDSDLWLRLANISPPSVIPDVLSISREYESTKTSTGGFPRVEELRCIAQKHTGLETTPGAILYFLDCLNQFIVRKRAEGDETFTPRYQRQLVRFWKQTAKLLGQYQVGNDGIPMQTVRK